MRVQTSVRRSVLQPTSRMRVLGQKSWISALHCHRQITVTHRMAPPFLKASTSGPPYRRRYLLQRAVDGVGSADVEAQEDCVRVAVAEGSDVVVIRRTWTDTTASAVSTMSRSARARKRRCWDKLQTFPHHNQPKP